MTIVAVGFLFFVYFFDWIIYGGSKFTLVKAAEKVKCKSRSLPINGATVCGAQDLNMRIKIKLDDSCFIVDTTYASSDTQNLRCRPLCLETDNCVAEITSSKKMTRTIQLGSSNVLLERPYENSSVPADRLVA